MVRSGVAFDLTARSAAGEVTVQKMFAGGVIFAEIIKICPVANGDRSVYKLTYIRYAVLKAHVHTSGRDRKQTACGFESLDSVNVPLNYFCTCSEKGTVKVGKNQNVRKILHDCSLVYSFIDLNGSL